MFPQLEFMLSLYIQYGTMYMSTPVTRGYDYFVIVFSYLLTTSSSDNNFATCSGFNGPIGPCGRCWLLLVLLELELGCTSSNYDKEMTNS